MAPVNDDTESRLYSLEAAFKRPDDLLDSLAQAQEMIRADAARLDQLEQS